MAKRDYVFEIEEIRGRTGPHDWDNGITKLLFLATSVEKLQQEDEALGYYPVAAVAALETYFRWEIKALIDSGDIRYLNRLRVDDLPLKITHELIIAVHGKRITIGELVAHSVRLSDLDEIDGTMGKLLGVGFLDLVKDSRDPELRREHGENAPSVIRNAGETFKCVKRTFELRHIICHEAHLSIPVTLGEVKRLCSSCYEFARASRYAIAHHQNPNAPLTLNEAYQASSERLKVLENEMNALEKQILSALPPTEQKWFEEMQRSWKAFVESEGNFIASQQMNGNRAELYKKSNSEGLCKARLNHLTEYAGRLSNKTA
jgi:uncharacterized protein YecT (DUF1311 family)